MAFAAGVVLAWIGTAATLAAEAPDDPSKYCTNASDPYCRYLKDPIPYCLSYIAMNRDCDRETKDNPWVCRKAQRDLVQENCIKWDEASIAKFCRGWTDGSSIFGEEPAPKFCNGSCWLDIGILPGFRCINPK
ncbi:hypothetical protein CI1B_52940 [Bradyrhizobium ivorense]|uniref:Uncharacterized protein n=1 Tax=Bradyrhizobium ivorense TaxID=2511166 RepID=A0A508TJI4_9BRAD|nr:hypothetical protein CI1B_52940 [Bradyrhizobium ivorense]